MIEDFLKKIIFEEPSDEDRQMSEVLQPICLREDYSMGDTVFALRYFNGIEPNLIITKVSVVNTPLTFGAMRYVH
jgi:hypothetical protein